MRLRWPSPSVTFRDGFAEPGRDDSAELLAFGGAQQGDGGGASGMVTTLPPLRVMTRVLWPRSVPKSWMSAPLAWETRRPFWASKEISACSAGEPSPAATSSAPSSLRSKPVACRS